MNTKDALMPLGPTVPLPLRQRFEACAAQGLKLDLTRGKPPDDLTALFDQAKVKTDAAMRNYGHIEGLPAARKLFAQMIGAPYEQTFVSGGGSLDVMERLVARALLKPLPGQKGTWLDQPRKSGRPRRPAMICPVPGYDRHHNIDEEYGIDMIPVAMLADGPDMDAVEDLVSTRPEIVGIWCIPIYGNPTGVTYSRTVCSRLAKMCTRNPSFRIFWDLAYIVHPLVEKVDKIPNMLDLCKKAGHEDRVFMIASTSKVTAPDSGLGILAASPANMEWVRKGRFISTIGQNKELQARHVEFLRDMDGLRAHMAKHRAILKPKFDAVDEILRKHLGRSGVATWSKYRGGYFTSLYVPGLAKRVIELAAMLGVQLTQYGSAYPYHNDPSNVHIRLAPTYPPFADVRRAMQIVCLCVLIAAYEAGKL